MQFNRIQENVGSGHVGISSGIEPMTAPSLAVLWRSEKPVNESLIGSRSGIGGKGVDLFGRRRQSRQVHVCASHQSLAWGLGRKTQSFGFELG